MQNIQFNYLYRDGANYKNYGFAIFENDLDISLNEIEKLIINKLIDQTWFYVDQWHLPDLHFEKWDNQMDHTFHEFENVEHTDMSKTTDVSISAFLNIVAKTNLYGFV